MGVRRVILGCRPCIVAGQLLCTSLVIPRYVTAAILASRLPSCCPISGGSLSLATAAPVTATTDGALCPWSSLCPMAFSSPLARRGSFLSSGSLSSPSTGAVRLLPHQHPVEEGGGSSMGMLHPMRLWELYMSIPWRGGVDLSSGSVVVAVRPVVTFFVVAVRNAVVFFFVPSPFPSPPLPPPPLYLPSYSLLSWLSSSSFRLFFRRLRPVCRGYCRHRC